MATPLSTKFKTRPSSVDASANVSGLTPREAELEFLRRRGIPSAEEQSLTETSSPSFGNVAGEIGKSVVKDQIKDRGIDFAKNSLFGSGGGGAATAAGLTNAGGSALGGAMGSTALSPSYGLTAGLTNAGNSGMASALGAGGAGGLGALGAAGASALVGATLAGMAKTGGELFGSGRGGSGPKTNAAIKAGLYGSLTGSPVALAMDVAELFTGRPVIKTGKHKDQLVRDAQNKFFRDEAGLLDQDYSLEMLDGRKFGYGGEHIKTPGYSTPNNKTYNIDWDNVDADLVSDLDALTYLQTGALPGEDGKGGRIGDHHGKLYNAINSGNPENKQGELLNLYAKTGLDKASALEAINNSDLDDNRKDVMRASINRVFDGQEKKEGDGKPENGGASSKGRSSAPSPLPAINVPQFDFDRLVSGYAGGTAEAQSPLARRLR